jgi:hypothetical protein
MIANPRLRSAPVELDPCPSLGMICHFAQTLGVLLHNWDGVIRESQRRLYNALRTRAEDQQTSERRHQAAFF